VRVQEAVLSVVADGQVHGYQIAQQLEEEWSSAAIYRALGRLAERGLIEPTTTESDSRRKPYRATAEGLKVNARRVARSLDSRHETLSAVLRSPGNLPEVLDELERRLIADIRSEPAHHADVLSQLAWDERRRVNGARLEWIDLVRAKVEDETLT
jgi:DNA-binding PadR family transcriptional regulator